MNLSERIKFLREQANLTQIELAQILNISNSALSQYESGGRVPSDEVKEAIADYFGVSFDYLYGRSNKPTPEAEGGPAELSKYRLLNPANKAIVDRLIADLADNQSSP